MLFIPPMQVEHVIFSSFSTIAFTNLSTTLYFIYTLCCTASNCVYLLLDHECVCVLLGYRVRHRHRCWLDHFLWYTLVSKLNDDTFGSC